MSTPTPQEKPDPSPLKTVQEMQERHGRHLARAAALEKKLADKTRFDLWHGKASARARLRELIARQAATPEIRALVDWAPLSPQESDEITRLIEAFKVAPWNPQPLPTAPKSA